MRRKILKKINQNEKKRGVLRLPETPGRIRNSLFLAAALSLTAAGPAVAGTGAVEGNRGPAWEIEQKADSAGVSSPSAPVYNKDVNTLKTAQITDQLILAVGDPEDPAKTTVTYYERGADQKLQPVFSVPAVSGMNGIATDKTEGDKKTPQGVYSFTMAFGMEEDPGSVLPYHKVVSGDYFVDDPDSRYYNRLVNENEVERDWDSGENLIRQAPHYNYALVLNYNEEYIPGKGSAIFLHCPKIANNTGTSGCISVPEEYAKLLVCRVGADAKIIAVPEEKELANY